MKIAAHIIDFKTNQLDPTKEESYDALKKEYKCQVSAYREHVAKALDLPESAVAVSLLSCPRSYEQHPTRILLYRPGDFV